MRIAGIGAMYLQALHPRAVRAVVQNSDFRRDVRGRLLRTAPFVGAITHGTSAVEKAGVRVRGVHRRLSATEPGTGKRFAVGRLGPGTRPSAQRPRRRAAGTT